MLGESRFKNYSLPNYLKRWINIKKVFPQLKEGQALKDADIKETMDAFNSINYIKKCKGQVNGMPHMLEVCGLDLVGRHHSGIDDARNIARCAIKLLQCGLQFKQGMVAIRK